LNAPCVSAPAGTTIQIIALGNLCFLPGTGCTEYPASLGGAFDSNNLLVSSASLTGGNVNRLTGSVNAPGTVDVSHVSYFNTYFGNIDTTIPNDFLIPTGNGIMVVVPTGANYLVVGVMDSYYADNSDPLNNLAVQINAFVPSIPEPGTIGLLAAGLGAFAFVRRERRIRRGTKSNVSLAQVNET
jgi:PEP-CTERM motif